MKIVICKRNLLDELILFVMLADIMIFNWLGTSGFNEVVLFCLIVVSMIQHKNFYFKKGRIWVPFAILILYSLLNYYLLGGTLIYFFKNMYNITKGILTFFYISTLIERNSDLILDFIKKCFIPFNVYFCISFPFMLLQCNGWYSSVSLKTLSSGLTGYIFGPDYMTGLFGIYAAPTQLIFFILIVMHNHFYGNRYCRGKNIIYFKIYNFLLLVFASWFALVSENKSFYIFLIIYIVIFLIISNLKGEQKKIRKGAYFNIIFAVVIVLTLMRAAYDNVEVFRSYVDSVWSTLLIDYKQLNTYRGGGERIALIFRAFSDKEHTFLGWGLGCKMGNFITILNMPHFGQADIGTYITLGGVIFIVLLYWVCYTFIRRNYNHVILQWATCGALIAEGIYTNMFSSGSTTMMITMVLYMVQWAIYQERTVTMNYGDFIQDNPVALTEEKNENFTYKLSV